MNTLLASPVIIVIFLSIITILLYLYKTSELINKRKLFRIILFLILFFFLVNLAQYFIIKKSSEQIRLLCFPLTNTSKTENLKNPWIKELLPEMVTKTIQRTLPGQIIIASPEWIYGIYNKDSLVNQQYLKNFTQRIKFPNYIKGTINENENTFNLTYKINDKNDTSPVTNISFTVNELPSIIDSIAFHILNYFSIPCSGLQKPVFSGSLDALQNYAEAKHLFLEKDYLAGLEKATLAIAYDSTFTEAYSIAGECLLKYAIKAKAGKSFQAIPEFNRAKYYFDKVVELDSTNDNIYRMLGEYYIHKERWSLAEHTLNTAYRINKNNYKIYIPLSRLHKDRFKKLGFQNETALIKQAIFLNPCYENAYLSYSDYYLFENKREQAIKILEQYLEIHPNSVATLMALGKIYIVRNDFMKIMEIYNKVIALEPGNSDAYYNLGILYYNLKDLDNSQNFFHKAISIDNHLNSYLYLAYISEIKGEYDQAIEYLRRRIRYKNGPDDEFAEEARKHLYKLLHSDRVKEKQEPISND